MIIRFGIITMTTIRFYFPITDPLPQILINWETSILARFVLHPHRKQNGYLGIRNKALCVSYFFHSELIQNNRNDNIIKIHNNCTHTIITLGHHFT